MDFLSEYHLRIKEKLAEVVASYNEAGFSVSFEKISDILAEQYGLEVSVQKLRKMFDKDDANRKIQLAEAAAICDIFGISLNELCQFPSAPSRELNPSWLIPKGKNTDLANTVLSNRMFHGKYYCYYFKPKMVSNARLGNKCAALETPIHYAELEIGEKSGFSGYFRLRKLYRSIGICVVNCHITEQLTIGNSEYFIQLQRGKGSVLLLRPGGKKQRCRTAFFNGGAFVQKEPRAVVSLHPVYDCLHGRGKRHIVDRGGDDDSVAGFKIGEKTVHVAVRTALVLTADSAVGAGSIVFIICVVMDKRRVKLIREKPQQICRTAVLARTAAYGHKYGSHAAYSG